jgi:hypothetical protein
MITIPVQVCGDHWVNPEQVKQLLDASVGHDITLDLGAEGAGLTALGITAMVEQHCVNNSIDPATVCIANWPNAVESVPFRRAFIPRASHFFWMSQRYWLDAIPESNHEHVLGLFVGRITPSRAAMLYDLYNKYPTQTLFSLMKNVASGPAPIDEWIADDQKQKFNQWWQQCPVHSIDQHQIDDQYNPVYNTNASLLEHYHRFDIEIVAETYALGTTFFPTEKTVRPIMAARPIIVYGPQGYLQRLHDLGFETYHELWDESYDQYSGFERWQHMKQTINTVMTAANRHSITQAAHTIAVRNRQHLETVIERFGP